MKTIIKSIIENLVDDKDAIKITELSSNGHILYEVSVKKEDLGKIIGKEGRIANSIRILVRAMNSKKTGKKTLFDIVEK